MCRNLNLGRYIIDNKLRELLKLTGCLLEDHHSFELVVLTWQCESIKKCDNLY